MWLNHSYGVCSFCFFVEELKKLPAPEVAVKYYTGGDFYLFGKFSSYKLLFHLLRYYLGYDISSVFYVDEFQTARTPNSRRPKIGNVISFDVFQYYSFTCSTMSFGTTKWVAQISLLCWLFESISAFIYVPSVPVIPQCQLIRDSFVFQRVGCFSGKKDWLVGQTMMEGQPFFFFLNKFIEEVLFAQYISLFPFLFMEQLLRSTFCATTLLI